MALFKTPDGHPLRTIVSITFQEISGQALLPTVAKLQSYSVINNVNKVDCFHKDIKFGTILMQTLVEKLFY